MSYSEIIYEVERLFNDIYEQMPICVNLLDSKNNIVMCNTKCSEFFGFDKKENYKKKFYKLFLMLIKMMKIVLNLIKLNLLS